MESGPSPIAGLLGFWMLLRLAGLLGALAGGIYALYCLSRAANGVERMASALEDFVALQTSRTSTNLSGSGLSGSGPAGTGNYGGLPETRSFAPSVPPPPIPPQTPHPPMPSPASTIPPASYNPPPATPERTNGSV